ncbi:MAG: polyprenyl synthetase family protein [Candidatus Nitrosocosmicus sp.]
MNKRDFQLNSFFKKFINYINKIDDSLKRELELYSWSEFYLPLKYACNGGKRIRPFILTLAAESLNNGNLELLNSRAIESIFTVSTAIELLHTESIFHDDILDSDNLRRGLPSFHVKYGYNASILTADFILGIILNIGSKIDNKQVIKELSNAAIKMSEGEMLEIRMVKNHNISQDDYIRVIENKTASLFEASAKIGAILGNGNDQQIKALASYGKLLGIAYQIHDDLIDYNNEERLFNILVKHNNEGNKFVESMENTYLNYSQMALKELDKIDNNRSKKILEELTNLESLT